MRRRGPGIGGLQKKAEINNKFESLGAEIEQASAASMQKQLAVFQKNLEEFAAKHKHKINKNPVFRAQFAKMCTIIGVDPLASSKNFWTQTLGVGDFYYELAVQLIELCSQTRSYNGGILSLDEALQRLSSKRSKHRGTGNTSPITLSDIKQAMSTIGILGKGIRLVDIGGKDYIVSTPKEMDKDSNEILSLAGKLINNNNNINVSSSLSSSSSLPPVTVNDGALMINDVSNRLKWDKQRVDRAIKELVREGVCWVDTQTKNDHDIISNNNNINNNININDSNKYWIPSLWLQSRAERQHKQQEQEQQQEERQNEQTSNDQSIYNNTTTT